MQNTRNILAQAYAAFNRRDIDAALSLMTDNVNWPKASEGGHVIGKAEIRAYWTRQWSEFNPTVEPLEIIDSAPEQAEVRVHQLVKSLQGEVLFDGEVSHLYAFSNGLIHRMDLKEASPDTPSAAFARH